MYTNKSNIPLPLAVYLATDYYEHQEDMKVISATGLLKPIKSLILSLRGEAESTADISSLIASRLGTSIHDSVEKAWMTNYKGAMKDLGYPQKVIDKIIINPDKLANIDNLIPVYLEQRGNKEVNGWTISGQFDFVMEGRVYDIKSTGSYGYMTQSNKDKYIKQGSIYRWLHPEIIKDDLMTILYVFTDWSSAKARQDKKYPQSRLIAQDYPLLSIDETDAFIRKVVTEVNKHQYDLEEELPKCSSLDLWERPTVYKYFKNPAGVRATKNFDNFYEAHDRLVLDGSIGEVRVVRGEIMFCKYCPGLNVCTDAKQFINEGRLSI